MDFKKYKLGEKSRSLRGTIKGLIKGEFCLSENFLNKCMKDFTQVQSIKLLNGYFILNVSNIEAVLNYDSCEFNENTRSITFKVLNLKPFYYKPFLNLIHLKFPFLKFDKDAEKTRLLTCHLNKIPVLKDNKIVNSRYLSYLTVKYIKCTEGKVAVKLKIPLKALKDKLFKGSVPKSN
ncbi:MAG: hypothetical protein NG784_01705 [Candidatus Jettenia sp.]|nr:hypothetical protein [Candidatus Jettenia sp.]